MATGPSTAVLPAVTLTGWPWRLGGVGVDRRDGRGKGERAERGLVKQTTFSPVRGVSLTAECGVLCLHSRVSHGAPGWIAGAAGRGGGGGRPDL